MTEVFTYVGYLFSLVCVLFALAWALETVFRGLWKRCMDFKDFHEVVYELVKKRRAAHKTIIDP